MRYAMHVPEFSSSFNTYVTFIVKIFDIVNGKKFSSLCCSVFMHVVRT
jgi:hypothetical protein